MKLKWIEISLWALVLLLSILRPQFHGLITPLLLTVVFLMLFYVIYGVILVSKPKSEISTDPYMYVSKAGSKSQIIPISILLIFSYQFICLTILSKIFRLPGNVIIISLSTVALVVGAIILIQRVKSHRNINRSFHRVLLIRNVFFLFLMIILFVVFLLPAEAQEILFPSPSSFYSSSRTQVL